EADRLLATLAAHDLGGHGRVGHERPADRGRVAVGHEQHALELDGVTGLGVKQLDLELGADLDAVLLSAGLDDCVHGSSGHAWRWRDEVATADFRKWRPRLGRGTNR